MPAEIDDTYLEICASYLSYVMYVYIYIYIFLRNKLINHDNNKGQEKQRYSLEYV